MHKSPSAVQLRIKLGSLFSLPGSNAALLPIIRIRTHNSIARPVTAIHTQRLTNHSEC